jgi:NADPH:quinone reductase-like Zn-dependent oxidoreductase
VVAPNTSVLCAVVNCRVVCFAGRVVKTGPGVTRFQIGDRVVTNSAGTLRNDARFGALQQYALTTQQLTAKVLVVRTFLLPPI